MGGIVCAIHRNAVLRFQVVPTKPKDTKEFDQQIRQLLNVTTIANAVDEVSYQLAHEVCDILAKPEFSTADRAKLLEVVDNLYTAAPD